MLKALTISEFVKAFNIFKNIICEAFPTRRSFQTYREMGTRKGVRSRDLLSQHALQHIGGGGASDQEATPFI